MSTEVTSYYIVIQGTQHPSYVVVIRVNNFQTELMVEIYSKSLFRAIGKLLRMEFS